jgi:hypothetical protein
MAVVPIRNKHIPPKSRPHRRIAPTNKGVSQQTTVDDKIGKKAKKCKKIFLDRIYGIYRDIVNHEFTRPAP